MRAAVTLDAVYDLPHRAHRPLDGAPLTAP
jgi:hypothetical protein